MWGLANHLDFPLWMLALYFKLCSSESNNPVMLNNFFFSFGVLILPLCWCNHSSSKEVFKLHGCEIKREFMDFSL